MNLLLMIFGIVAIRRNLMAYHMLRRAVLQRFIPLKAKSKLLLVDYYMNNASIIREGLSSLGLEVFGGVNAPYIWLKTPNGLDSWEFFDKLLRKRIS